MTAHLRPCPGCSRHVRVSEGTCPFCGASLDASFRSSAAPIGPSRRLSRAALFAFSTGAAVLTPVGAIDCAGMSESDYGGPPIFEDGGEEPQDSARAMADVRMESDGAGDSSAQDSGSPVDAGSDAETDGAASDAQSDASVDAESDAGDAD